MDNLGWLAEWTAWTLYRVVSSPVHYWTPRTCPALDRCPVKCPLLQKERKLHGAVAFEFGVVPIPAGECVEITDAIYGEEK
jgi:hypothetical protein